MADANPQVHPQAPNAAEVILELSNELGVQVSELPNLPVEFLAGVIAASGRTNAEKAAQHLALFKLRAAEAPLQQDLAHYFRERDARELFPWKSAESAARVQHEAFRTAFAQEAPFENLKRIFVAQAKGGLIAPLENVVLQYLLFGDSEFARFVLGSLLLNVPVPSRLSVHNWFVAAHMAPARREMNGKEIAACPWPLFPEVAELMTLNARLLSDTASAMRNGAVSGGSAEPVSTVFAKRAADEVFGAGFCPLVGPDGVQTHALNTTTLEEAIAAHLAREREAGGRNRANHNQNSYQHTQRGRGRGGRGRGGRGRGGRSYFGGDADGKEEGDEVPKNE